MFSSVFYVNYPEISAYWLKQIRSSTPTIYIPGSLLSVYKSAQIMTELGSLLKGDKRDSVLDSSSGFRQTQILSQTLPT